MRLINCDIFYTSCRLTAYNVIPVSFDDVAGVEALGVPGIDAGLEGVRWVENCVRSADAGATWVDYL